MTPFRVIIGLSFLVVVLAAGIIWVNYENRTPQWALDGLNEMLTADNRDFWWDNPDLATKGCLLKRKSKRFDEAVAFCDRAIELSPNDTATQYEAAMLYRAIDRTAEAIPLLEAASESGHDQAPAFLAASYLSTMQVQEAAVAARRARETKPAEPYSWSMSCFIEAAITIDGYEFAVSLAEAREVCSEARAVASDHDAMKLFEEHMAADLYEN